MSIRRFRALLTALLVAFVLLVPATPARPNKSTNSAVDEVFADLQKPGSPGCALGVYRDGKIIFAKGYGLANIEEKVLISPQTVFDVGSVSKQFTAASILLLEKQGELSLSDDVRKYVPELPDYGQKITILDLLSHTGGLRDYTMLLLLSGINIDNVTTDDDALAILARQKAMNFAPGSEFLYCNSCYFLMSVIVKRVTGKSLKDFAAEKIFQPLGMTHTEYRDDHTALIPNRALAYDPDKRGAYKLNVSYAEQLGDGGVHTSIEDLSKWDENFYSAQIGGKDFVLEMQEPGKLANGKVLEYARGLFLGSYRGLKTVSHSGGWGGYHSYLLRFPDRHFSVACLCNVGGANHARRAYQVADIYLADVMQPKEEKKPARVPEVDTLAEAKPHQGHSNAARLRPDEILAYAGTYFSEELGVAYQLAEEGGNLVLKGIAGREGLPRANTVPTPVFRPVAMNEFQTGGEESLDLHFRRDDDGLPASFVLDAWATKGVIFIRKGSAVK